VNNVEDATSNDVDLSVIAPGACMACRFASRRFALGGSQVGCDATSLPPPQPPYPDPNSYHLIFFAYATLRNVHHLVSYFGKRLL